MARTTGRRHGSYFDEDGNLVNRAPTPRTRRQASSINLKKARLAKRTKAHKRRVSGAKRTKVSQSIKKAGVSLDVGFTGKVTKTPKYSGGHAPKKRPAFLATEKMDIVISPRGRGMSKGVTDPLAKPPKNMPQSKQDYFLISRAIRHAAYDYPNSTLELVFETGDKYHFYDVPFSVWHNFQMAASKGRFFMTQIYGYWSGPKGHMTYHPNYQYSKI